MDAAEAKAAAEKARPLLQSRGDALAYLKIGEHVTDISDARQLWDKFSKADFNKFSEAIVALKKALFKERDEYGIISPSWDLEKIDATKKAFDKEISMLPSPLQAVLRVKVHRANPEGALDKDVGIYERVLQRPEKKETPKPKKVKELAPKEDNEVVPHTAPEQPKGKPVADTTKWPTTKNSPGVKRLPAQENQEEWLKIAPAISEMMHLPNGEGRSLSEDDVDNILIYLDNHGDASEEEFLEASHKILPEYYDVEALDKKITELKEEVNEDDNSANELAMLEQQHNHITKMDGNLKFIYQHWIPMETKSNLTKDIGGNKVCLIAHGDRKITLITPEVVASIKFSSDREACEKFLTINTEEDVESTFSLSALIALEKEAAGGMESLIKPDTKGPSAEEEKPLVTAIVEWLNASNIQGSEADVEKKAADYLASKAPDYDDANIQRVARKVYAEWTASKKVPGAVGQEGKAGMGVANIDGTGVFVEPQRGDTNVQNEAPTGDQRGNVRKEAGYREELADLAKEEPSLDDILDRDVSTLGLSAYPAHGLMRSRIRKIRELVEATNLGSQLVGLGPKSVAEIDEKLKSMGLHRGMNLGSRFPLSDEDVKGIADQTRAEERGLAKEAVLSFRSSLEGEVKTSDDLNLFSTLDVVSFVEHIPGHKNSKGEAAPWVIKSHETQAILSSHATEGAARKHLQEMHMFKSMGKEAVQGDEDIDELAEREYGRERKRMEEEQSQEEKLEELRAITPAIRDAETGQIFTGANHANAFDNVMKSDVPVDVKRRAMKSLELENENTGFQDTDGKFITRAQAKEKYGFATSEELATKIDKGASMNAGDTAVLNTQVGDLPEGTEVEVVTIADGDAAFIAGTSSGVTKVANLDKATSKTEEKYPWDNDGLEFKFCLGDRVKVGSIEHNGESWKGEEGIVREKVVLATNGEAERFYLVELDCGGNETLPEESLSKAGKKKEAALNAEELTKVAVIKPNFDAVQDFLKSYDNPPSVVTTDDIEHWMADEKNNYQYSKKDLKEFVKYLESAHVEVRVPAKKKVPEVLPGEAGEMGNTEAEEAAEFAPPKEMLKEAVKYKTISPDGKSTTEKDIDQDMGAEFDTDDPVTPGQKVKWTREGSLDVCSKCAGQGSLPCPCMDGELWLSTSCNKCKDEGSVPCSCKQPA